MMCAYAAVFQKLRSRSNYRAMEQVLSNFPFPVKQADETGVYRLDSRFHGNDGIV